MFRRRHRKSKKKLPSVELVSFTSASTEAQSVPGGVKPLENGGMVLPNHPAIRDSEGLLTLPQLPTTTEGQNGRQVLPQQPSSVMNQDWVLPESEDVSKPSNSASSSRVSRSLLPMKAHSIVHHKSSGTVVTSASFGVAEGVECESEHETVEMDFEDDVFTTGMTYPSIVRRKRSDTIASLRIDCTYDL